LRYIVIIFICLLSIAMAACSPRITRHGYELDSDGENSQCNIVVTQFREFSDDEAEVLARVDIGDTGFTITCEESDVLNILKDEGCMMGAHVVNITREKRADWWSNCYRAGAEFLRLKDNPDKKEIKTDTAYDESAIERRVAEDKRRKMFNSIGVISTGLVAGFLIILF
jgi:hypothetical protein